MKSNKSKISCKRGFTLIELLVVVLIIGILAAVAVPQYQKAVEKSRATQALTLLKSTWQAAQSYYLSQGTWPTNFNQLSVELPWTGTQKWHNSDCVTDTKSNGDWAAQICKDGNRINLWVGRISGPYTGAGFGIDSTIKDIQCIEDAHANNVSPFAKPQGSYCKKIFHGTVVGDNFSNSMRKYRLP